MNKTQGKKGTPKKGTPGKKKLVVKKKQGSGSSLLAGPSSSNQ
jgi:hypothetical protein